MATMPGPPLFFFRRLKKDSLKSLRVRGLMKGSLSPPRAPPFFGLSFPRPSSEVFLHYLRSPPFFCEILWGPGPDRGYKIGALSPAFSSTFLLLLSSPQEYSVRFLQVESPFLIYRGFFFLFSHLFFFFFFFFFFFVAPKHTGGGGWVFFFTPLFFFFFKPRFFHPKRSFPQSAETLFRR